MAWWNPLTWFQSATIGDPLMPVPPVATYQVLADFLDLNQRPGNDRVVAYTIQVGPIGRPTERAVLMFNVAWADDAHLRIDFGPTHQDMAFSTGDEGFVMETLNVAAEGENVLRLSLSSGWLLITDLVLWYRVSTLHDG